MRALDFVPAGQGGEIPSCGGLRNAKAAAELMDRKVAVAIDEGGELFPASFDNMQWNPHGLPQIMRRDLSEINQ